LVRHHDGAARGARAAVNATAQTGHAARLVLGDRSKLGQLLGGSVAVTYLHAFAFVVCVSATGGQASWADVVAVYLVGTALAALVPTPGNLGAEEAALFVGLTTMGVAAVPALAGVLWFRLVSFWLPTLPGAVAFGFLLHRRRL
jgi:undecaprenyl-diphosphatase